MIRLLLIFFWRILYYNPLKLIYIITSIICFNLMGTFPMVKEKTKIESEVVIHDVGYNIFLDESRNDQEYILIKKDSGYIIEDNGNKYLVEYRNDKVGIFITILFWLMLSLLVICFLWDILGGNDDTWFSFSYIMNETIIDSINCTYEGNIYYYTLFGRLIDKGGNKINMGDKIFNLTSLRKYPKYKTPSDKRNYLIEKIVG